MTKIGALVILLVFTTNQSGASVGSINLASQSSILDSIDYSKRKKICLWTGLGGTAIAHAGLYQLWYKDYPSSRFHFFNDNYQWMQMDKVGHAYSAYYLGLLGIEAAKWSGIPESKRWQWSLFGSIFQNPIEIWDGFSDGWGASTGDIIANTLGSALCASQEAIWHEQKFILKYSYSASGYAQYRPNTLGSTFNERLLKDYNAQTYWLCYSPIKQGRLSWLGVSIGYGANGMLGGEENIWTDKVNIVYDRRDIQRYRQYYLSADINLSRIKSKNPTVKTMLFLLNCIKVPLPGLEYSQGKLKGKLLAF